MRLLKAGGVRQVCGLVEGRVGRHAKPQVLDHFDISWIACVVAAVDQDRREQRPDIAYRSMIKV